MNKNMEIIDLDSDIYPCNSIYMIDNKWFISIYYYHDRSLGAYLLDEKLNEYDVYYSLSNISELSNLEFTVDFWKPSANNSRISNDRYKRACFDFIKPIKQRIEKVNMFLK